MGRAKAGIACGREGFERGQGGKGGDWVGGFSGRAAVGGLPLEGEDGARGDGGPLPAARGREFSGGVGPAQTTPSGRG